MQLQYPKKSHRKDIRYPRKSSKLAEFMGIVFGDGGINNDWQLTITLNSEVDREYSYHVLQLAKELFDINVAVQKRKRCKALVLRFSSMNLLDFLFKMGAVKGNKIKQRFDIPAWVYEKESYTRSFIRGLIDTDGCLYIHKHKVGGADYCNIGFCFSSYSENLMRSVASIFESRGIKPHLARDSKMLYLYSVSAIRSYLDIFKTSNPRIKGKYLAWRGA